MLAATPFSVDTVVDEHDARVNVRRSVADVPLHCRAHKTRSQHLKNARGQGRTVCIAHTTSVGSSYVSVAQKQRRLMPPPPVLICNYAFIKPDKTNTCVVLKRKERKKTKYASKTVAHFGTIQHSDRSPTLNGVAFARLFLHSFVRSL